MNIFFDFDSANVAGNRGESLTLIKEKYRKEV